MCAIKLVVRKSLILVRHMSYSDIASIASPKLDQYLGDIIPYMRLPEYRRLGDRNLHLLIRCFIHDVSATKAARIVSINRKTVNSWYFLIRTAISRHPVSFKSFRKCLENAAFKRLWKLRIARLCGIPSSTRALHRAECIARYYLSENELAALVDTAIVKEWLDSSISTVEK